MMPPKYDKEITKIFKILKIHEKIDIINEDRIKLQSEHFEKLALSVINLQDEVKKLKINSDVS